jgi:hypothetical protein
MIPFSWNINENDSLPANPLPISNPLLAGRESIAFASSASSLSKTGEPRPYKLLLPQTNQLSDSNLNLKWMINLKGYDTIKN